MYNKIIFRMHAYSDAAGKFNPDAVRSGNEDNFYVDDNLSDDLTGHCESDVFKELSEYGLIMAVADGMGGMNAGEVASEIAVETIQDFFSPGKINAQNSASHETRKKYLEALIVEADKRIKKDAASNPEHDGMGSTIILAWIVGNELTLSWCGDSRAYRFNAATGIQMLSEDHSYVQELVQKGLLTYDQTFEHPQGNIVTRSLGDDSKKIRPETRFFNIYDGDVILLCSDGLSGVLRDRKTPDGEGGYYPGDTLEDIIAANRESLVTCREVLWQAAEHADWYDNVTAILCEIQSGAGPAPSFAPQETVGPDSVIAGTASDSAGTNPVSAGPDRQSRSRKWIIAAVAIVAVLIMAGVFFLKKNASKPEIPDSSGTEQVEPPKELPGTQGENQTEQTDTKTEVENGPADA